MKEHDTTLLLEKDFEEMQKYFRVNFFNSVMGFKNTVLIGTQSKSGSTNLAIFSSLIHMGSNPPLFGVLFRPSEEVPRHTLHNMEETGFYTLNNILEGTFEKGHQTSAKYDQTVSEFGACGLTEEYLPHFLAPFVKESTIKMGLKWLETIPITQNNTQLVIGQVITASFLTTHLENDGYMDVEAAGSLTTSGLDSYHITKRIKRLKRAKT